MKRYSWKYMAGLVDGEGCIDMQGSVNKDNGVYYCRPRFRLTLSGPAGKFLIPQFIANYSGTWDGTKERQWDNPNWQTPYTWCLTGSTALRKFLQNIVNHTVIKQQQIRFAIWWLDNIGGKHVTDEVRRFGVDELKAMKKDPHRLSERAVAQIKSLFATDAIVR
jgi:hypothetical protein